MYRSDASSHGYIREPLWDSFNDGNDGDLPKEEDNPTFLGSTKHLFMHGRLNLLLIFFPFAVAAEYLGISEVGTFFICMLAIIPMAERIAYLSEQLTLYTNAVIGALMTVTFANISELCINLAALFKGYYKTILWNAGG
jgi:Ca2+/H+ antiporter